MQSQITTIPTRLMHVQWGGEDKALQCTLHNISIGNRTDHFWELGVRAQSLNN